MPERTRLEADVSAEQAAGEERAGAPPRRAAAAPPAGGAWLEPEDAQLVAAFLAGEPEAAATVRAFVVQALRSYTLPRETREDVVQEALLRTTSGLRRGAFRGEAQLKTYVWKLANHVCLNALRAQSLRAHAPLEDVEQRLAADAETLVDTLARAETGARLEHLARLLPGECRTLWALVAQGLSYREMSARLGLAEGTLRVRAHRCRRRALALWEQLTR